ncbi:MAG TPA: hypothetical protein VFN30_08400 [Chitinophagaceae bacterium]|nr:hypothetical protein [Chitinophagaceae bacterium]
MRKIAIHDANILIDLVNIGLFSHCLTLKFQFCTTQLIFDTELNDRQTAAIQIHIDSGKFEVIKISEQGLLEIQTANLEDKRLSEQDWSVICYAQKLDALLLSGDKILRKVAESKALEVRGILWVLDQLVDLDIISKAEGCNFLKELIRQNRRLPPDECQTRIDIWCGK